MGKPDKHKVVKGSLVCEYLDAGWCKLPSKKRCTHRWVVVKEGTKTVRVGFCCSQDI